MKFTLQDADSARTCEGQMRQVGDDEVWVDVAPYAGPTQGPTVVVGLCNGVLAIRVYGAGIEEPLVVLNFNDAHAIAEAQNTTYLTWEPL